MTDIELIRQYCISKGSATEEFPFDDINLVFKVAGKMFAMLPLDKPIVVVKCDPERAIDMRERHEGINPAWHFNKRHWNQIALDADIPTKIILGEIDHSYDCVVAKLPLKARREVIEQNL